MEHFRLEELVDKETFEREGECAWSHFDPDALVMLDDMTAFFKDKDPDCYVVVNNWHKGGQFQWRGARNKKSPEYTPNSMHTYDPDRNKLCGGFDCTIRGYMAQQARIIILANEDHLLLKGIMRIEGNVSWLHIDNKPVNKRIYVFKA